MALVSLKNPYPGFEKGLHQPFDEKDQEYFYGRYDDAEQLKVHLRQYHLSVVTAPSNFGKTSLINAGLVPYLKSRGFLTRFSKKWQVIKIEVLNDPLQSLAEGLALAPFLFSGKIEPNKDDSYYQAFKKKDTSLAYLLEELSFSDRFNLLLVLDDFENLLNHPDKEQSKRFLNLIYKAIKNNQSAFYCIFSCKPEYLRDPLLADMPVVQEFLIHRQFNLNTLNPNALQHAIAGPAKKEGIIVEDEVCQYLMEELLYLPDQLPKLQRMMNRTWWELKNHKSSANSISFQLLKSANGLSGSKPASSKSEEKTASTIDTTPQPEISIDEPLNNITKTKSIDELFAALDKKNSSIAESVWSFLMNIKSSDSIAFQDLVTSTGKARTEVSEVIYHFSDVLKISQEKVFLQKNIQEIVASSTILKALQDTENQNYTLYQKLSQAAVEHYINEAPLESVLKKDEITAIMDWIYTFKPTEQWAARYNQHYEMGMDLLDKLSQIVSYQPSAKFKTELKSQPVEQSPTADTTIEKKTMKINLGSSENKSSTPPPPSEPPKEIKKIMIKKKD